LTVTEEKMVRIYARRIVAFVQDEQTIRDDTVHNLPRRTMSNDILAIAPNTAVIIAAARPPVPEPTAAIRLWDIGALEPFGERNVAIAGFLKVAHQATSR
jgi:hypothetical protein